MRALHGIPEKGPAAARSARAYTAPRCTMDAQALLRCAPRMSTCRTTYVPRVLTEPPTRPVTTQRVHPHRAWGGALRPPRHLQPPRHRLLLHPHRWTVARLRSGWTFSPRRLSGNVYRTLHNTRSKHSGPGPSMRVKRSALHSTTSALQWNTISERRHAT